MSACVCVHAYVRIWFELEVSVAYGNAEGLRDSFSKKRKVSNYSPFFMVKCFCIWENVLCFHWERQELKFKVCKSAWWAGWAYGGSLETFHWHVVSFSSLLPLSHWAVSPKLECRALLVLPVCERCWLGGIWFEVPLAFKSWIWRHEQLIG